MSPWTRRTALRTVPALAAGFAGCNVLSTPDEQPPVPVTWTADLDGVTPGVRFDAGPLVVGSDSPFSDTPLVAGLDPETGEGRWDVPASDDERASPVAGADGVAYVFSTVGTVYAVTAESGRVLWQTTLDGLPQPDPGVAAFPPLVLGDVLAVPVSGTEDDAVDRVVGLGVDSGERRWVHYLDASLSGAPGMGESRIVLPRVDGVLECIDGTGTRRWTTGTTSPLSAATVSGDTAYVGSVDECLSAYALDDGTERWCHGTENAVLTEPRIVDGTVYVGAADYYVYAVATDGGTRRWRTETRNAVTSGPVPFGDALVSLSGGAYDPRGRGNRVPFDPTTLTVHGREDGTERRTDAFEGYLDAGDPLWVATMGEDLYLAQEYQLLRLDGGEFDV